MFEASFLTYTKITVVLFLLFAYFYVEFYNINLKKYYTDFLDRVKNVGNNKNKLESSNENDG